MCGIAGFIGSGDRVVLERMTRALAHRGPDAEGFFVEEGRGVHFGHRRLSIVDLAGGAQPMATSDGSLVIVFNGEIYNQAELRAQLVAKGYQFQSDHSDTEVLLYAYREWGEGMLDKLNGMWAFAIYDQQKGSVFLARDRFGKKPLYYFHRPEEGGVFAFASELTALQYHPQAPRHQSLLALKKYFAYGYIPAPHSLIEGIYKLPGGYCGRLDLATGTWRSWRYWEYRLEPCQRDLPDDGGKAWGEELLERLDRAVKRRLMSDVPLGVFLSGGIDSSAVAALAARHLPAGRLKTFSIGFTDPSFDELPYARQMAAHLGCSHHEEILDLEMAKNLLPGLLARLDEPLADASLLPTWLLSGFTRRHVTVALGGDGGDELFAGYDPFRALHSAELYSKMVPKVLHPALCMLAAHLPVSHHNMSLDFKIKRTLRGLSYPPSLWAPVWMGPLDLPEINEFFGDKNTPEEIYSEAIEAWEAAGSEADQVDRTLQFFTRLYLQDDILTKVDRASMLHSLEARSPFLDLEVVDFARRLPNSVKLRGGVTKWILKKALEPLLPHDIIYRKKKGFGVPIGLWLKDGFLIPIEPKTPAGKKFFNKRLQSHQSGKSDERLFLWAQYVLSALLNKA
ncbi:MAG: asparagine synthase (glutamine-hydrolyzing) [Verrucomicrobia bacterium RIFCSPHIGHO2_12_FULL_41_10]|nr:MAG: asparagine synthase (glutamine-hydrolyzing) [Verrucomicrobia bacterium RIFCSPHIGHO2_12_FULL_41_10]HLB34136.1 asparagine synthase (glutamine-hydrolyzing) [Chthoniobacterales bacterium]